MVAVLPLSNAAENNYMAELISLIVNPDIVRHSKTSDKLIPCDLYINKKLIENPFNKCGYEPGQGGFLLNAACDLLGVKVINLRLRSYLTVNPMLF